ncbi:hypothetical protein EU527_14530 [Candidatus Thorarchaeota archaeon]|nr:MAG: hypothetical protein EU527_14530 [Candidatus Thorarchaeota archaeon]
MTGQIADAIRYKSELYNLIGIDGEGLFTPEDFDISTRPATTACWRGFQMLYDCINGELILEQMNVNTPNATQINGVEPTPGDFGFSHLYEDLKIKTKFSGKLLLGKDFISSMYVHMGFQSVESFETVIELEIENGNILQENDLSAEMEKRREQGVGKPSRPSTMDDNDVMNWIEDRFSQDYKSE